jgi:hypothetical protein
VEPFSPALVLTGTVPGEGQATVTKVSLPRRWVMGPAAAEHRCDDFDLG